MSFLSQVRVSAAATVGGNVIIETSQGQQSLNVASRPIAANTWTRLSGYFTLPRGDDLLSFKLLIDGPPAGVELCGTDIALEPLLLP